MELGFLKEDETLDDLQIKGIHIIQKKNAFRFGVDSVLLANFARIRPKIKVIDLCSGTGIIPFIIAGKTSAEHITGIEIQRDMVDMAKRSIAFNKMEDRISFVDKDITDVGFLKVMSKVDVITVNPPYKLKNSGIINKNDKNAIARHEIFCTLEDVVRASKILLKDNGRFYMIHRPDRLVDIMCCMRKYEIEPKLMRMIHPCTGKAPNMVLVEGRNNGGRFLKWDKPLYIHTEDGGYTEEINKIYGRDRGTVYESR
ncbi:MAG: tRNA1(Val) (adenine(37)-N6)-methyltransferase [Clostridium sp.]|jgi:tRNA1(Val) A37 N6-methylase TrmN6|uniref:tRNA1(Val) (adenine(37)-N6)-methyltransferase n=1 Tax=Clostridium sp. TaxID=1506 RepID=UPI0025C4CB9F|nr:tRNA1(Val) (adenine(37)-N6)-methyltransferase [Clostridium sp.]MCH3965372.1 tRNA1(Val) (adenine(37)-N6)-methyltransferase [Clostridium sp.]MCI1714592.1 tRNA1(Val) (adenine(37)-N6)-methyltransferase [Clostridium sp.]MCI1798854.1 tRNA1(Val) (adenine(37)-N6)-methyltransferase [Clostridium sp.]MCI1812415.1 tRNA1(Val) (adenine(37)-N6)-methyltransferase [Clostridium sp.]MCI1869665.1 tRNA1(Val) (adenine(37)-N6)-methyltransferase [Clostridium sp.]